MGVPITERRKAIKYIEEVKKEYKNGEEFDESEAGWHPQLAEIADMTRNADDREPEKSEELPDVGGKTPKVNK